MDAAGKQIEDTVVEVSMEDIVVVEDMVMMLVVVVVMDMVSLVGVEEDKWEMVDNKLEEDRRSDNMK